MGNTVQNPSQPVCPAVRFQPTVEPGQLREEVLELIEPWRNSLKMPPFTMGELLVIVLAINERAFRLQELYEEILDTFAYYGKEAKYACSHNAWLRVTNDEGEYIDPLSDLFLSLVDFDHPNCLDGIDQNSTWTGSRIYGAELSVAPAATRLYLRDRLEPQRQGVFHFMRLPAELREKIFKMVLVYPKPGLALSRAPSDHDYGPERLLGVVSLNDVEDSCSARDRFKPDNDIAVESLTKTLAILRVSKQFRREALPVFYGNTFKFGSLRCLLGALKRLSDEAL